MINLKEIVEKYPECLNDSKKFKAVILDLYPNEKLYCNILSTMLQDGIVDEIKNKTTLDSLTQNNIISKMEKSHGYDEKYIGECLRLWAKSLNIGLSNISTFNNHKKEKTTVTTTIPIIQNKEELQKINTITPKETKSKKNDVYLKLETLTKIAGFIVVFFALYDLIIFFVKIINSHVSVSYMVDGFLLYPLLIVFGCLLIKTKEKQKLFTIITLTIVLIEYFLNIIFSIGYIRFYSAIEIIMLFVLNITVLEIILLVFILYMNGKEC